MTIRSIGSAGSARRGRLVRSAIVVAAVAICRMSYAGPAKTATRTMSYDEAIALLQVPQRWCDAAAALVRLGDRRAIRPLHRLAVRTEEGLPDRGCVRDALEKLGARDEVETLVASTNVADRRTGIELMRACPADAHAALLGRIALHDPDPDLRRLAARTLRTQRVTAAWDVAMIALLDAGDSDTRALAATALQHRYGVTVLAALRNRRRTEPQAAVRGTLDAAIHCHEDYAATRP